MELESSRPSSRRFSKVQRRRWKARLRNPSNAKVGLNLTCSVLNFELINRSSKLNLTDSGRRCASGGLPGRRRAAADRGGRGGAAPETRGPRKNHMHLPLPFRPYFLADEGAPRIIPHNPRPRSRRVGNCVRVFTDRVNRTKRNLFRGIDRRRIRYLGDAACRVVESVGEAVEEVAVGDTVLPVFLAECGDCADCGSRRSNQCSTFPFAMRVGMLRGDGASRFTDAAGAAVHHFINVSSFVEYTVVDVAHIVKVNKTMPPAKAALLSCGISTGSVLSPASQFLFHNKAKQK